MAHATRITEYHANVKCASGRVARAQEHTNDMGVVNFRSESPSRVASAAAVVAVLGAASSVT